MASQAEFKRFKTDIPYSRAFHAALHNIWRRRERMPGTLLQFSHADVFGKARAREEELSMTMSGAEPDLRELGRLLQEAGSTYDPQGVETLIEGVLAAPDEVRTSWHTLLAYPVTPALAGALEALRAAKAKTYRNGLSAQDFERLPRAGRLSRLREELEAQGLNGFIVPRADEHQGEYVPPRGQRLAWLTGFTGSAGLAIVLGDRAALFVDGRYTLQAAAQIDTGSVEIHHLVEEPPAQWLAAALKKGEVLGYDPWLHTPHEVERFHGAAEKAGAECRAVHENPLDRVWPGQPAAANAPNRNAPASAAPWPRKGLRPWC